MSTPEGNLGGNGAEATLPVLEPTDAWILSTNIDDPLDGSPAPLPTAADADAIKSATTDADTAQPDPSTLEAQPKIEEAKVEGEGQPPLATAETDAAKAALENPDAETKVAERVEAATADPELTQQENDLVKSLPEAEQPAANSRFKRAHFMDHYLNLDKPASEVVDHLAQRSPSRFAEVQSNILERSFDKPEEMLPGLFERSPETYSKLATAVYKGDPKYFTKQVTGRDNVTPDQVQTALEFYDRHKDSVVAGDDALSEIDEAKIAEIAEYFPEEAESLRKQMEMKQRLESENQGLKDQLKGKEETADPDAAKKAADAQATAIQKEVDDLWNMGRDTVGDFLVQKAFDPKTGVGVYVSPEERTSAPLVALLKDFKASVLFDGIVVEGKPLLDNVQKGLTDWGKDRKDFVDKILHMDRFTQAREKDNVLDVAKGVLPYAETYYNERLKHPIFTLIDQAIALATEKGATPPKVDPQNPGRLPAPKGTTTPGAPGVNANDDSYMIADALARSPK